MLEKITYFKSLCKKRNVQLVAVSKNMSTSLMLKAYEAGIRDFGENTVQSLCKKYEHLPKDIRWHFIGHLQRNKVKYIAPFIHLIHSVDRFSLLEKLNQLGQKHDRVIACLLQIKLTEESTTKHGFHSATFEDTLKDHFAMLRTMRYIHIKGLMGIASNTMHIPTIQQEFALLKTIFENIKSIQSSPVIMQALSMGMSNDYLVALQQGTTMLRIGNALFK